MTDNPQTTDIVIRLREGLTDGSDLRWAVTAEHSEAADEIERLRAVLAAAKSGGWKPIATAPRDRPIVVYAPPYQDLDEIASMCQWHQDAGFCIDELREPTHWLEKPG